MADDQTQTLTSADPMDELNDLRMSEKAMPLLEHVKRFIAETVDPMYEEYVKLGEGHTDRWTFAPGQLEVRAAVDATFSAAPAPGAGAGAE